MAITLDDFNKIWASASPLTPYSFTEANYKRGWDFVGSTPPSRQMWDAFMQTADEKSQWLYNETVRINQIVIQGIPVGVIQAFAGSTTPDGWLLCDGSAVSRTDYSDLYAVIGDTYGDGDGSTTFNVPDLIDKFVEGSATAGTAKAAGLPNIEGHIRQGGVANWQDASSVSGAFDYFPNGKTSQNVYNSSSSVMSVDADKFLRFNASVSNSIYGNSNTVQPPALTMRYIIKY